MDAPEKRTPVTLFICRTCGYKQVKNPDGTPADNPFATRLAEALQHHLATHHPAESPYITIKKSTCLSVCDQGIAWGLRAEDRFCYTLAHAPQGQAGLTDLAATALAYLHTRAGGKIPKAALPDNVRPHILSKLPPVA